MRRIGKASIRRAVASSTAIETDHSVEELEEKLEKNENNGVSVQLAENKEV